MREIVIKIEAAENGWIVENPFELSNNWKRVFFSKEELKNEINSYLEQFFKETK